MGLSRPTRMMPDKASFNYQAINTDLTLTTIQVDELVNNYDIFKLPIGSATNYISTPFTFSVNGSTPIKGIKVKILTLGNNVIYDSGRLDVTTTKSLYPVNYLGEEVTITTYVPNLTTLKASMSSNFKWTATVYWDEYNSQGAFVSRELTSPEVYFETRLSIVLFDFLVDGVSKDPDAGNIVVDGLSHTFEAIYDPESSRIPLKYFSWKLYTYDNVLIYDTGMVYSQDVKFYYDGFLPFYYNLELTIVNTVGSVLTQLITLQPSNSSILKISYQLQITNIPEEACLRISWDRNSIQTQLLNLPILQGYELYRRKRGETFAQHLFTLSENATECFDYNVANGEEYVYYLYPKHTFAGILAEVSTYDALNSEIYHKVSFEGWVLSVLTPNESQNSNVYRVFKQYMWQLNLTDTSVKNNAIITINNNYTPYPKVQKGKSNYMSVALQCLMGYINCETNEIQDTQEIIDDVRNLSSSNYEMILRSPKGAIMRVTPITELSYTINEKVSELLTSMNMEFAEIGRLNNMVIINKVANPAWMFTSSGYQPIGTLSMNLAGYTIEDGRILAPSSVTQE